MRFVVTKRLRLIHESIVVVPLNGNGNIVIDDEQQRRVRAIMIIVVRFCL